ncbi:DNA-processing protein DprA [Dermatophilus congolensis]|uniref:DNA-processing protein DprA n=1 Tax=Dermatophilus congolensis TaxID=1863 RepID=UPI001AAF2EC0|nr:DNA-processing protein DprA [Dermatophilus congolensis]
MKSSKRASLERVQAPLDAEGIAARVLGVNTVTDFTEADSPEAGLDRMARAAWTRLAEPGNVWAHALIQLLGPVQALAAVVTRHEEVVQQFTPRLADLNVLRDFDIARRYGARLIVPSDDEWPSGLADLEVPPVALWARGPRQAAEACSGSVAIVGARNSTDYGINQAGDLAWSLAERGRTVVSGAAYGIDAAAHHGALAAHGTTVAVLACGIDKQYPAANAQMLAEIAQTGLILSEVAPGSAALRSRFLQRNRLIAAISAGTVVVEAGLRSGSRNTAGTAASLGRVVMAFPGPVTSMASAGCHVMIRDGMATLVTDMDEVIELMSPVGEQTAAEKLAPSTVIDSLDASDAAVHDALSARPRSVGKIATIVGMGTREVLTSLGRLELEGFAINSNGHWRRPTGGRSIG